MSKFTNSKRRIIVGHSGWVWCGIFSQNEAESMCYFDDAYCVRIWGTTEGLGQLCEGPLSDTILDPIPGRLSIPKNFALLMYDVDDTSWDNFGITNANESKINSKTKYFSSKYKIFILRSGWVLIGESSFDPNTKTTSINNAYCVKNWGTRHGLGEICSGPTSGTELNRIYGTVKVPEKSILATYEVDDIAWSNYLKTQTSKFTNSKRRIVVGDSGWVWNGIFSQNEGSPICHLDDAYCIRIWGATEGLGQLCEGPLNDTILDPIPGRLSFHEDNVIMTYDVNDTSWDNFGITNANELRINSKTQYFSSKYKIVIINGGWVLIGKWSFDPNTRIASISKAYSIKNWGTKHGLGDICSGPTSSTELSEICGIPRVHEGNIIATYEVDDVAWRNHFKDEIHLQQDKIITSSNIKPEAIKEYNLDKYVGSKRKIVIGENDWVWIGILTEDEECYYLRNAYIISESGTTRGIRELCAGPTSSTILDPIEGLVTLFKPYIEAIEDVDDEVWEQYGLNLTDSEENCPYPNKKIHCVTKFENSESKIVMYKCGWAAIGNFSYKKGEDETILDTSLTLQEWGTSRGLGELCNGPLEKTQLDINRGTIRTFKKNVLAVYDVDDFVWDNYKLSII
jgi:hypothetical protein